MKKLQLLMAVAAAAFSLSLGGKALAKPQGGRGGGGGGGGGFASMFGQPSAESQALQKAIEDKAPAAQLKTLIAKLQAVRKQKLAELAKAQEDLRAVLTTRQEAIAIMGGLLN